jgi:hypothetical protein
VQRTARYVRRHRCSITRFVSATQLASLSRRNEASWTLHFAASNTYDVIEHSTTALSGVI